MRRLTRFALCCLLAAPLLSPIAACKRQRRSQVTTVEEEAAPLASVVNTADSSVAIQLVKGFHEVEQNAWRWTRGEFAVTLRSPEGAATRGATLEVKLAVPDTVISRLQSTTLSAKIGNIVLEPQLYTKPGEYTYTRDIAPSATLAEEAVTVDFSLDKFLAAGMVEGRELGIVVSSISLLAK